MAAVVLLQREAIVERHHFHIIPWKFKVMAQRRMLLSSMIYLSKRIQQKNKCLILELLILEETHLYYQPQQFCICSGTHGKVGT